MNPVLPSRLLLPSPGSPADATPNLGVSPDGQQSQTQEHVTPDDALPVASQSLPAEPAAEGPFFHLGTLIQSVLPDTAGEPPPVTSSSPAPTGTTASPSSPTTKTYTPVQDPTLWNAARSSDSSDTYRRWASNATFPQVQGNAQTAVTSVNHLLRDQRWLDFANAGIKLARAKGTAPDIQGKQQPLSYWQNQQNQAAQAVHDDWIKARQNESTFWDSLNQATGGGAQDTYGNYLKNTAYTTEGMMPAEFVATVPA